MASRTAPTLQVAIPCTWNDAGLAELSGRVRFRRRFSAPGQIDAHERVWLTFEGGECCAELCLNGHFLGRHEEASGHFEYDVTPLLKRRNELTVDMDSHDGHGSLWGEVALEVRCSAFLANVRWWTTCDGEETCLHVAGDLVGTADRPLELYVLVGGTTAIYTTLQPQPTAAPFHAVAAIPRESGVADPGDRPPSSPLKIELVNGAVVWHAIEGRITV
jgi:hypothetical protein